MPMTYEEIRNKRWEDVPKPKSTPPGRWVLKCRAAGLYPPRSEEGKVTASFIYEPYEPQENVTQDDLDALEGYNVRDNRIEKRFWLEGDKELNDLRNHMTLHGVEVEEGDIEAAVKGCVNTEISAFVSSKTRTDKVRGEIKEDVPTAFRKVE